MRDLTWSRDGLLGFKGNLDFGTGRGQRSLNNCSKGKFRLEPPWPPWTGFSKKVSRILLNEWRLAKNVTERGNFSVAVVLESFPDSLGAFVSFD